MKIVITLPTKSSADDKVKTLIALIEGIIDGFARGTGATVEVEE